MIIIIRDYKIFQKFHGRKSTMTNVFNSNGLKIFEVKNNVHNFIYKNQKKTIYKES